MQAVKRSKITFYAQVYTTSTNKNYIIYLFYFNYIKFIFLYTVGIYISILTVYLTFKYLIV